MRIISLFAGCGGMDLGFVGDFKYLGARYASTGVRIVAAVESDPQAASIYRQNIGAIICGDVRDIGTWPDADILIGGPPCQPFSAAGKRLGPSDARDMTPAFARVLKITKPPIFVMENVAGLAVRKAFARYFTELLAEFESLGYAVFHRVLEAADYGVPQRRKRLFVIGVREDVASKNPFPKATHGSEKRPHRTVREAIADLNIPVHTRPFRALKEGRRRHPKFGASSRRLIADAPFPTVKAVDTNENRIIHPWYDRYLSMPELLRAQSFPDDFIVGSRTPAVGNAVPPLLAWRIARRLREILPQNTDQA